MMSEVRTYMPTLVYGDEGEIRADMCETEPYNGLYTLKCDMMRVLRAAYKAGYEQARSDAITEETRYEEDGQPLNPLFEEWVSKRLFC